jgi:uncharacterized MAPEG superfamily protein
VELKLLVAAVIVGIVQIAWAAAAGGGGERNFAYLTGPRDDPRPVGTVAGRLDRALKNFLETFPLFAAALLACVATGKVGGTLTVYGAGLYVAARAIYVPLYAAGTPVVRTLVWTAAMVGIFMVIVAFFR